MDWTKGNIVQSVISITLVNATAKTVDITVPAGKRWLLLNVKITNPDSVQRSLNIYKYKESAKTNLIGRLVNHTMASASEKVWPITTTGVDNMFSWHHQICYDGNVISMVWDSGGASSGGTDADGIVVEYLEVEA